MQKTHLRATVNTLIGLLAVGTIVAGAAERLAVRSPADITRKLPIEKMVPPFQGQVCLIDSTNCTEMNRYPPRLCLLAPQSRGTRGVKVVLL